MKLKPSSFYKHISITKLKNCVILSIDHWSHLLVWNPVYGDVVQKTGWCKFLNFGPIWLKFIVLSDPYPFFKKLPQVRKLWNDEVLLPSMEYMPLAQVQDRFKVLALYGIHLSRILIWHKLVWNNLRVLLSKGWKEVINCHFHCIRWNHPSCWKPCGKIRSTKSWNPDKVYLPWPHQSWIITVNRLIFS